MTKKSIYFKFSVIKCTQAQLHTFTQGRIIRNTAKI